MNDLISRQEAIAAFKPYALYDSNRTNAEWVTRIESVLEELPSAEKRGKWIERERYRTTKDGVFHTYRYKVCSICGRASGRRMNKRTRYCPNCGARMDGEE